MEKLLPDICRIQYGFAFDSTKFSDSVGTPLIRIRDVVRGYSETYTTEQCGDEYVVQDGDMLIGMDGEFNIAHWKGGKAYLNQRVCRLIPTDKIDALYLFYFMPKALKTIEDKTPFVTVKHLSAKELNKVRVPMPPIAEQENIAASLQKVDELISLRKQQLVKLDELVKARFVEFFGDPVENPNGYYVATLQELIDKGFITYHLDGNHGGDYPRSEEFVESGIPYISANCIVNGEIDFTKAKYLTSDRAAKLRKGIAQDDDVLFAHNATVGPTVVLHTNKEKVILGTSLTAYRCNKEKIMPNYLKSYMLSNGFVCQYSGEMKQTTRNQVPITVQKKYLFLIPPIEEQNQFAAFVKQTDKSKLAIQQGLDKLELLKKALMQKYFG